MTNLSYSQNFLHSRGLIKKLLDMSDIAAGDNVLEVGAGKGIITSELSNKVGKNGTVIAVEKDKNLLSKLKDNLKDQTNISIISGDILKIDFNKFPEDFKVLSNLPFNITSEFIYKVLGSLNLPESMFLILEKESLVSKIEDGGEGETFKSLLIKPIFDIKLLHNFSRSDFYPQPSVKTAFFSFKLRDYPLLYPEDLKLYKNFLSAISKDRVGEGIWQRLFTKNQLRIMQSKKSEMNYRKGLKSQTFEAILEIFNVFKNFNKSNHPRVDKAGSRLETMKRNTKKLNAKNNEYRFKGRGKMGKRSPRIR